MKKFFFLTIALAVTLVSCTQEETLNDNSANEKMLDSYVIKRNANGSYTLTHNVTIGVNTAYNDNDKVNEVQLFFDGKAVNNSFSRDYTVTNNELNINFITENTTYSPKIKIIDDNTSEKGTYGLLNDYTVSENADGTVQLAFVVDAGVEVSYVYNEVEKINEIKLTADANASQLSFTQTYTRNADGTLKIDFVQPATTKDEDSDYKKPRLIFNETES
jgi:hypothetical protein